MHNDKSEKELQEKIKSGDEARKKEELRIDELLRQRGKRRVQLEKEGLKFAGEGDFDVIVKINEDGSIELDNKG